MLGADDVNLDSPEAPHVADRVAVLKLLYAEKEVEPEEEEGAYTQAPLLLEELETLCMAPWPPDKGHENPQCDRAYEEGP